ncbi:MAG TPA: DUF4253 domain-containing protein [Tepidisphaeraceae bacterium]|nr:DUF4253 domain-containing protein [Tepidisphaeraceae bacterium]
MNDATRSALRELGFDDKDWQESQYCPGVFETTIAGGEGAIAKWSALRDQYGETGYWPILRGETLRSETPSIMNAPSPPPIDVAQVLVRVPRGTVTELIDAAREKEREALEAYLRSTGGDPSFLDSDPDHPVDDDDIPWPNEPVRDAPLAFTGVFDILTNKPLKKCGLSLLPAKHPAHAPAHLGFGGWNEVPPDEVLVAILMEWHRRFGAVPAVITTDVMEFAVDRPPQTEQESMALAHEQYKVCGDIVDQGVESVRKLGIMLWRSPTWYFWWD